MTVGDGGAYGMYCAGEVLHLNQNRSTFNNSNLEMPWNPFLALEEASLSFLKNMQGQKNHISFVMIYTHWFD